MKTLLLLALFVLALLPLPAITEWVVCDDSVLGATHELNDQTFLCTNTTGQYRWVISTESRDAAGGTDWACAANAVRGLFARVFSLVEEVLARTQ